MSLPEWVFSLSTVALIAAQIALSIRVVARRSPVSNSHAWLVLIIFVPVFGMFLYLLVGENRLGDRRARRFERTARELEPHAFELWAYRNQTWEDSEARFQQIARLGNNACNAPALAGNALEIYADPEQTLDAIIGDIDEAKDYCHVLSYIFQTTGKPLEVCEALARAAERGVECRLALDGAGSKEFFRSGLPRKLRERGVEVLEMLPVSPVRLLFRRIDLRNHRKVIAIDGRVAYCGSQNITDSSFNPTGKSDFGPWVDTTLRVTGPAAQALALVFASDWNSDAQKPIEQIEKHLPDPGGIDPDGSVVQVLPSGPGMRPRAIQAAFITTIYAAREELIMTTPYFVPDEPTLAALLSAAGRGVEVTLVIPKRNNAPLVAAAGRATYPDLLDAGVKIMHYRPGLLHSKTLTVDREITLIGSANIDQRSFWINFEITLAVYDSDFTSRLRMLQREYINQSDIVEPSMWAARSKVALVADRAAGLLSPLL